MDRLAEISRELLSEYDSESPNYWVRVDSVKEVLDRMHDKIRDHKEAIIESRQMVPGIPVSSKQQELYREAEVIRSDPFIPRRLRDQILEFFEGRADVMRAVYIEEIEQYRSELTEGKHWDKLDTNYAWLHNRILAKMSDRGCGIEQIKEDVHTLRNSIQDYFEKFDPIKQV
jgi:hypothetical protein